MKISPCLDTVYKGFSLEDALLEISELGYPGFEFWHTEGYDIEEMLDLKNKYHLELSNFDAQEISLVDPRERLVYVRAFEEVAQIAKRLDCENITVLSGNDTGKARAVQARSLIEGLKEIAPIAEELGFTIVLEASNRRVNRPHNFLISADDTFEIIDSVGSSAVKMLYDVYHQQISEGDLLSRILDNIEKIGHFHAAGVPGRHELGLCEINYDYLFKKIAEAGYSHWIGLEYFPEKAPRVGLQDLRKYLTR